MNMGGLYVIINAPNSVCPLKLAREVIRGGASFIQLRYKGKDHSEAYLLAKKMQRLCKEKEIPFIINDHVDLALQLNASGVHLGASDVSIDKARKILGEK